MARPAPGELHTRAYLAPAVDDLLLQRSRAD